MSVDEVGAAAGCAGGIVQRPQEPRLPLDEHEGFALIPGMVAERDGVGARREDLVA